MLHYIVLLQWVWTLKKSKETFAAQKFPEGKDSNRNSTGSLSASEIFTPPSLNYGKCESLRVCFTGKIFTLK